MLVHDVEKLFISWTRINALLCRWHLFMYSQVDIVDEDRCLIKISAPRGSFLLQAPSADILHQLHQRLTSKMAEYKTMSTAARKAMRQASLKDPSNVDVKSFASMSETVEEGFEHATEEHDEASCQRKRWQWSQSKKNTSKLS